MVIGERDDTKLCCSKADNWHSRLPFHHKKQELRWLPRFISPPAVPSNSGFVGRGLSKILEPSLEVPSNSGL